MDLPFEIKCPDLNEILASREALTADQFDRQQRMQIGLNELINIIRMGLISNKFEVFHDLFNISSTMAGFSEEEIDKLRLLLERKNFSVSVRPCIGLYGMQAFRFTVALPERKQK
ncbi:MAG TPA: hypothetical protein VHQ20_02135 [Patescibacteria group bacterium]|jgi:hypothetical protein|nr:hypothetical protein [Patescibacteria group bacterium]